MIYDKALAHGSVPIDWVYGEQGSHCRNENNSAHSEKAPTG